MSRVNDFIDEMAIAGVQVTLVSFTAGQTPPDGVVLQFGGSMTQEQRDYAYQQAAVFEWVERRDLDAATIFASLGSLTTQQQNSFLRRFVCELIRDNKKAARRAVVSLGIVLPIDEVDPNP